MSHRERLAFPLAALLSVAACGDGGGENTPPDVDAPPVGATAVLKRPSKSSTVAISEDDSLVAIVNPDDDSVSFFRTSDDSRIGDPFKCGDEPSSVVIAPDGKTAYVSNRAAATVVKITGIDSGSPQIADTASVGSEPSGVALSPTGARLYVAEYAEGRITVLSTATMDEIGFIEGNVEHPRTVAVTNDNDDDDDDELVIVPEFFGEANLDNNREALEDATKLDQSRIGRVRIYDSRTLSSQTPIIFRPRSSGITPTSTTAGPVFAVANQLYSVGIRRDGSGGTKIYLPSVSAAPQRPVKFDGNVYPIVWVGDLNSRQEDTSNVGTVNLAERVISAVPGAGAIAGKFFLNDIVDLDFVPLSGGLSESNVYYVISRGADAMQRVTLDPVRGVVLGVEGVNLQVDLIGNAADVFDGCKGPTGIILRHDAAKAYVNCWTSHRLAVVNLGSVQALARTVVSFDRDVAKESIDKGRRFFATGRGRWSGNSENIAPNAAPSANGIAAGNCMSCHPDGLSDNITWTFGTGPRQTTSLDGTFSKHGTGTPKQRALNWTAIFDELHDFDKNTRDTSGVFGAITTAATPADCGKFNLETRQTINPNVVGPTVRELQNTAGNCVRDWDDIDNYVKTIRPPKALKRLDPAKVALGKQIFGAGTESNRAGCVNCHGGPGFTVSSTFYVQKGTNTAALADPNNPVSALTILNTLVRALNNQTLHLQPELAADGVTPIVPPHITCGLRNLDTFGPTALEIRDNGNPAQGKTSGFNVPSLYGMSLGAPYLHSGLALTLDDLLDPAGGYTKHLRAGNANFNPAPGDPAITEALVAYVLSIDADTDELAVPNDLAGNPFDVCPPPPLFDLP